MRVHPSTVQRIHVIAVALEVTAMAKKKLPGLLQNLRDEKIQRELQRQGSCNTYLQNLRPTLTSTASRTDDTAPYRKSAVPSPDRKRDGMTEKSDPRFPAKSTVVGLSGLRRVVPPFGPKSEKAGAIHSNAGAEYQRKGLRPLWQPGAYRR